MSLRKLSGIAAISWVLAACGGGGGGSDPVPAAAEAVSPTDYATAFRFLKQASFGPAPTDLDAVMTRGIEPWLDAQLAMPDASEGTAGGRKTHLQRLEAVATQIEPTADWYPDNRFNTSATPHFDGRGSGRTDIYQMSVWFENALQAPDQLRQRMAYALSQILVTSAADPSLERRAEALAHYYDLLAKHAFGNFRDLLGDVARSPAMGIYLSHQGNEKASADGLTLPDENFARELMQLFVIGLYELNADGTPRRDGGNALIPTYTQQDIEELAKVMTGWDLRYNNRYGNLNGSHVHFMEFSPDKHQSGTKQLLGTVIPDDDAGGDLDAALDLLFQHSNVGPFIGKQLIQRLVSSNPSPAYVARVSAAFADNGEGVRGDLAAVLSAILLDPEARQPDFNDGAFGKVQEPLLAYTAFYRAFNAQPVNGWRLNADTGGVPVSGAYYFRIHGVLGQGALRAHHVFNFYDNDFVPQDSFYRNATPQKVLPEMQLQTPNNIAGMFTAARLRTSVLEINDIRESHGSLAAYIADRNTRGSNAGGNWNGSTALALLDYTPALQAFERGMEGDANGDYALINDATVDAANTTPKQRGIEALLDSLQRRLLGGQPLPELFREELSTLLHDGSYFNTGNSSKDREANRVVAGAIQYVLLSSLNLAQR